MRRWLALAVAFLSAATEADAAAAPRAFAIDGDGAVVEASAARASLQRTPPAAHPVNPSLPHGDPDALRYGLIGHGAELPSMLDVVSVAEDGAVVGTLRRIPLVALPCARSLAPAAGQRCAVTAPIRVVADAIDAGHPLVRSRSVRGRLGGGLRLVGAGGAILATVRVAGPQKTALGPIERLRGKLRFIAVRLAPGGALPVGGTVVGARDVAVAAVERVNALWGACGVSFGSPAEVELSVVEPPPSYLLAVGCDHGVRATGGELRFRVAHATAQSPGRQFTVATDPGMDAPAVARRVAEALGRAGWAVTVSDNPPIAAGAGPTSDVLVRSTNGAFARLDAPSAGDLSSDEGLGACIGEVNLEDGLQHFTDVDSMVGTVEERSLIKAFDDHDPTTIEVYLVPGFGEGGRIGESFIGSDGGSMRNVVIIDRAGIRSNRASFTLAHELGHVLLDDPGHPDDFGVDLPTRLMDADAADGSAFGPRRLSLAECARAVRQSGPSAPTALLTPWPLAPLASLPPAASTGVLASELTAGHRPWLRFVF